MIYWTAKNNSSYLNGRRSAKSMRAAVLAAREYLRNELYGEGVIYYFDSADASEPIRTDRKDIFTGNQWSVSNGPSW